MRVVTGASGFVGSGLIAALLQEPAWSVTAITRRPWSHHSPKVRSVAVGDLTEACLLAGLLADTDAAVHAAATTMVPPTAAAERVRAVNVAAAVAVARAAAKAGVSGVQARTRSPRPAPATACQISDKSVRKDLVAT
jgi:nucleoside-diphosphate-sugar epimerase